MTKNKRFIVQERCVVDTNDNETFEFSFKVDAEIICEELNKIEKENEQLNFRNSNLMKEVAEYSRKAKELEKENEQLKQDRFICLDCKHSGYTEIGCLCEKKDHWTDYKSECEDYEELE